MSSTTLLSKFDIAYAKLYKNNLRNNLGKKYKERCIKAFNLSKDIIINNNLRNTNLDYFSKNLFTIFEFYFINNKLNELNELDEHNALYIIKDNFLEEMLEVYDSACYQCVKKSACSGIEQSKLYINKSRVELYNLTISLLFGNNCKELDYESCDLYRNHFSNLLTIEELKVRLEKNNICFLLLFILYSFTMLLLVFVNICFYTISI